MAEFLVEEKGLEELLAENSEKLDKKEEIKQATKIDETEAYIREINEFEQNIKYEGGLIDDGQEIKNYHYKDVISKINVIPRGDSYDNMVVSYETEVLAEGQQIISEIKENKISNKADVYIDSRTKDTKDSLKLFYPATWQFMYEAKGLTFN